MEEIFKDIVGYEGLYQVSNLGTVKSIFYRTEKVLKRRYTKKECSYRNYACVMLWKDKNKKKHYIHKLVANAFIPKIEGKTVVNHIDNDKLNNSVDNLEWVTASENSIHGLICGYKSRNPNFNYTIPTETIIEIRESMLDRKELAIKHNLSIDYIDSVLKNKIRVNTDAELKYFNLKNTK
jgi:hypothetical protein